MRAAKFKEQLFIFPAIAIVVAARVLPCRRLRRLVVLRSPREGPSSPAQIKTERKPLGKNHIDTDQIVHFFILLPGVPLNP
jgi:hypothetical protein